MASQDPPRRTDPAPAPASRSTFLIVLVLAAILIAAAVGYLGLTGRIGGGIPGTQPGSGGGGPTPDLRCEGKGATGSVYLSFVGGASTVNGGVNFNGTTPGPCADVGLGAFVTVNFSVAKGAGQNHTWDLVPAETSPNAKTFPAPVFAGAAANGPGGNGVAPGTFVVLHFTAASAGDYRYICEMTAHYAAGMWGWFNVTAP